MSDKENTNFIATVVIQNDSRSETIRNWSAVYVPYPCDQNIDVEKWKQTIAEKMNGLGFEQTGDFNPKYPTESLVFQKDAPSEGLPKGAPIFSAKINEVVSELKGIGGIVSIKQINETWGNDTVTQQCLMNLSEGPKGSLNKG